MGKFWELSPPPPPPRSRSPRPSGSVSHISETPEPLACPRSFAEVVRARPGATSPQPLAQPLARPTLKSTITVPSPRRDAYRRAYELERTGSPHPMRTTPSKAFKPAEPGWTTVRPRHWWRTNEHSRHRLDSRRQDGTDRTAGRRVSLSLEEFKARTRGRCFVCLVRDHRASVCRDPPRCFACNHTGHRARHYKSPRSSTRHPPRTRRALPRRARSPSLPSRPPVADRRRRCSPLAGRRCDAPPIPKLRTPPPRKETESLPPPPLPPPFAVMAQLGDPETHLLEDVLFIPTSHAIDAELREWESTAAVTWAMRAPPTVTAKDVERIISDEFGLRAGELAVTLHHPEAFILKFKHRSHCEEAVKQGFAKARGIEVHFIQWRSLKNAAGSALMYRVKLCLDGVSMHLWAPDIAERIISRTCTLETVETDLVHPVDAGDTRVISLWAWTPNPSRIHKHVWVMITRQIRDPQLESVTISERPPEHWQQGVKHPVLFHIEEIHDYTVAAVDLRNPKSCRPASRT